MPAPSQGPYDDFASDGVFPPGADPWSGQPNTVTPSGGFITRGFMAGEKFLTEYLNHLIQNLYLWIAWLAESRVSGPGVAVTDNALVRWDSTSGTMVQGGLVTQDDSGNLAGVVGLTLSGEVAYDAPKARVKLISPLTFVSAGSTLNLVTFLGEFVSVDGTTAGGAWAAPLELPSGSVVQSIDILFDPGSPSTTTFQLEKRALDFTTPGFGTSSVVGSVTDDGTSSLQARSISGLSEAIDNDTTLYTITVDYADDLSLLACRVNYTQSTVGAG